MQLIREKNIERNQNQITFGVFFFPPVNNRRYMRQTARWDWPYSREIKKPVWVLPWFTWSAGGSLPLRFPPITQLSVLCYFSRLVCWSSRPPAPNSHPVGELYWGAGLSTRRHPQQSLTLNYSGPPSPPGHDSRPRSTRTRRAAADHRGPILLTTRSDHISSSGGSKGMRQCAAPTPALQAWSG